MQIVAIISKVNYSRIQELMRNKAGFWVGLGAKIIASYAEHSDQDKISEKIISLFRSNYGKIMEKVEDKTRPYGIDVSGIILSEIYEFEDEKGFLRARIELESIDYACIDKLLVKIGGIKGIGGQFLLGKIKKLDDENATKAYCSLYDSFRGKIIKLVNQKLAQFGVYISNITIDEGSKPLRFINKEKLCGKRPRTFSNVFAILIAICAGVFVPLESYYRIIMVTALLMAFIHPSDDLIIMKYIRNLAMLIFTMMLPMKFREWSGYIIAGEGFVKLNLLIMVGINIIGIIVANVINQLHDGIGSFLFGIIADLDLFRIAVLLVTLFSVTFGFSGELSYKIIIVLYYIASFIFACLGMVISDSMEK